MKAILQSGLFALAIMALAVPANAGPYKDGVAAAKRGDYATALKIWRPLAEQGDARSQKKLGNMYSYGRGVSKDVVEGANWYRKAADQGHAEAQMALGASYYQGEGVPKDNFEAFKWIRKAAEQGYVHAQNEIAFWYETGIGVSQDYAEAVKWYQKAALAPIDVVDLWNSNDRAFTFEKLGEIFSEGRPGVPANDIRAFRYYSLAVDFGHSFASDALEWFKSMAEKGDERVQFRLGLIYESADDILLRDYTEANKWYRKAAEQGHFGAQENLGIMYLRGKGVLQDFTLVHMWLNIAGANGSETAQAKREDVARRMTPDQIAEAQRLAREWMAKHPQP